MTREFDLRDAINAVSDVVANRPPPLREFDQIYMKVADMVIQAHYIAERFHEQDAVFIGDGDAIALTVMHLGRQEIFKKSPRRLHVLRRTIIRSRCPTLIQGKSGQVVAR